MKNKTSTIRFQAPPLVKSNIPIITINKSIYNKNRGKLYILWP